jgi:hypothetical protein
MTIGKKNKVKYVPFVPIPISATSCTYSPNFFSITGVPGELTQISRQIYGAGSSQYIAPLHFGRPRLDQIPFIQYMEQRIQIWKWGQRRCALRRSQQSQVTCPPTGLFFQQHRKIRRSSAGLIPSQKRVECFEKLYFRIQPLLQADYSPRVYLSSE